MGECSQSMRRFAVAVSLQVCLTIIAKAQVADPREEADDETEHTRPAA
jgi:hypothetical protein